MRGEQIDSIKGIIAFIVIMWFLIGWGICSLLGLTPSDDIAIHIIAGPYIIAFCIMVWNNLDELLP